MKETVFSGVKPTSIPHIGNYIGALRQWVELQKDYNCYYCIVDDHAITVPQDPKMLREQIYAIAATYLAVGIDPKKSTLFLQSDVAQHTELGWLLMTQTKMGELSRMTQYKDKSKKTGSESAGVGLFAYPVLMAADILLYDTNKVPVGHDQMQHIEFTRFLARRFNEKFGQTFVLPQPLIQKVGARIMSLKDPSKKMSKSDESGAGTIMLTDEDDVIQKKIMRAVTDSTAGISYDPEKKPAVSNLMSIYHHVTGDTMKKIEDDFGGKGYGDFKKALAEVLIAHLSPIRTKINEYLKNPKELNKILDEGFEKAHPIAEKKVRAVKDKMGLAR
ncbi:MAG: tryptophan--tRNA ligase [Patescibacteria group bacterium]|nr:tryptophan--tRNA ligase [Patescibacteria group bacterium]